MSFPGLNLIEKVPGDMSLCALVNEQTGGLIVRVVPCSRCRKPQERHFPIQFGLQEKRQENEECDFHISSLKDKIS